MGAVARHTGERKCKNASAGNRTRVTSMATMYSTTRPLMQLLQVLVLECAREGHRPRPTMDARVRRHDNGSDARRAKALAKGLWQLGLDCNGMAA